MIYGIGIDIVHIPKFKKAVERWGDRFKNRIFTQNELIYCENRRFSEQHLAVRFAAKEAFLKALVVVSVKLSDIEVVNNQDGKPYIKIAECGMRNVELKLQTPNSKLRTHLTLSHDGEYCIAQVILEAEKEII
ncbi:MAG: holo-ACP synthase [Deltaproteobacteria bacterium]|nr:holo-ACP synthase [Deltaproteobacteria bacterium]